MTLYPNLYGDYARMTDNEGRTLTASFAKPGMPASMTDNYDGTYAFGYDCMDNPTELNDPLGGVWTSEYDTNLNAVVHSEDPLGNETALTRDAAGGAYGYHVSLGRDSKL